ncbi:hypothetical protein BDV38DRAFT_254646 [Aspergillus pseudotamarii]|uniref:Uncharacterized protein n=1 Tax=Aspergillus pseudotamarii TaxID=132259 RepID=A0A5N6SLB9_ASPPS|nr:uncharacterized protein BDV38DRAFT_254646 [Aspergillus pseudotamarii]KAE8134560.1 hypothetical protein BDV38DRAFT_254646 [Aspergillus pseudotamarii]
MGVFFSLWLHQSCRTANSNDGHLCGQVSEPLPPPQLIYVCYLPTTVRILLSLTGIYLLLYRFNPLLLPSSTFYYIFIINFGRKQKSLIFNFISLSRSLSLSFFLFFKQGTF